MLTIRESSLVALAAGLAVASGAGAANPLQDWNLMVRTNLVSTSEVDGSALIGGNVSGTHNYAVQALTAGSTGLAIGGNINNTVNINNGGNLRIAGSVLGTVNLNGGGVQIADPGVPGEVSAAFSVLDGYSSFLQSLVGNGTIDGGGNMNAVPTLIGGQMVAVYNFNIASVQALGQLNLNMGAAQTVILNVASSGGVVDLLAPPNLIGGFSQANSSKILWNFYDATTLQVNNSFNGAVLALDADLQLIGGGMNGSVAVNSVSVMNAEIRRNNYQGLVPAPGAAGLLAIGGLVATRRRR